MWLKNITLVDCTVSPILNIHTQCLIKVWGQSYSNSVILIGFPIAESNVVSLGSFTSHICLKRLKFLSSPEAFCRSTQMAQLCCFVSLTKVEIDTWMTYSLNSQVWISTSLGVKTLKKLFKYFFCIWEIVFLVTKTLLSKVVSIFLESTLDCVSFLMVSLSPFQSLKALHLSFGL